jgi:glycosyltransferase involved in cell wall biosynthesis
MLADDRPGLRLEIIGDGPLDGALLGQARELGLDDRVDFRGPLPSADVQEALIRCALLVVPCPMVDSVEGAGLPPVLLEAMTYGTPAVTIDSVCLPQIVRDDATGLLVAPDDPAGLAVAIATLLDDPVRAARLGAAGGRLAARLRDRDESEFA